eukprot:201155_1
MPTNHKTIVKDKHPGYLVMIQEAIISLNGTVTKSQIIKYIQTNYPSSKYKIANGNALKKAIKNNLTKKQFTLDKNTNKYKVNTIIKIKSKRKTKSKLPHRKALSKYRCCELHGRMDIADMEFFLQIVRKGCLQRKKSMDDWNAKLKVVFDGMDKDKDGKISAEDVKQILITFVGYKITDTLDEQVDKIMEQCDSDKDGFVTFQELLVATPPMHRFYVYNYALIPELCKKGYKRYGENESHAIADIFRETANELIPNNYYLVVNKF